MKFILGRKKPYHILDMIFGGTIGGAIVFIVIMWDLIT